MKRNSHNCNRVAAETPATHKITGEVTDSDCWATGVEWHHGAGHSKGRGVFLFWAKSPEQAAAVEALAADVKARKEAKKARRFTSKAAAWRHVAATKGERTKDAGHGYIEVRDGKFGLFVSNFGTPDFTYYFCDQAECDDLCAALKIS